MDKLKEIRNELLNGVIHKDWLYIKLQINKLDSIIYANFTADYDLTDEEIIQYVSSNLLVSKRDIENNLSQEGVNILNKKILIWFMFKYTSLTRLQMANRLNATYGNINFHLRSVNKIITFQKKDTLTKYINYIDGLINTNYPKNKILRVYVENQWGKNERLERTPF